MDAAFGNAQDGAASKTCTECGRVFTKAAHLLRHQRSHAQQKPFGCGVCRKAFARTDALQRHERTVHSAKHRRTDDYVPPVGMYPGSADVPVAGPSTYAPGPSIADAFASNGMGTQESSAGAYHEMNLNDGTAPFAELGSLGGLHTFPPPSFLTTSSVPSNTAEVDSLIAEWLNQDGGALATENALAVVFSDQTGTEPADYMTTDAGYSPQCASSCRPEDSEGASQRTYSPEQLQSIPSNVPSSTVDSHDTGNIPDRMFAQLCRRRRTVVSADTWESGITVAPRSEYDVSRPDSPQPSVITSPDQVVGELRVNGVATSPDSQDRDGVIPSMKFLDACLHLYFRDFHPLFPVIHRPTFQRDRTSPLLLLSMCSIGCMFVGTQAARDSGLWIYERLHYVIVVTRDSKMATEATRLAVLLSALLGQCFSFLYGKPKQMLTAESFHGTLGTMARRSGLSKKLRRNPVGYEQVEHLGPDRLKRKWREWGLQETLRRVSLGLTIHAAELTAYSGLARLIPTQVSEYDGFSDALFEANDAETWRTLLLRSDPNRFSPTVGAVPQSDTPEVFLPTVLLAQSIVNIHTLRELESSPFEVPRPLVDFYDAMLTMASRHGIYRPSGNDTPLHVRALSVLWHYTCAVRLAPISVIEEAAGRGGSPTNESIAEIREWVRTPAARLATLHCGHALYQAADLKDLSFLLPRAIFQSTLLLFCYISFAAPVPPTGEIVDVLGVVDWHRLVQICDAGAGGGSSPQPLGTPAERYVAHGRGTIHIKGLIDGKEKQLDMISLRSTSNRLLRRCTPWGVGDTLGDILSSISF